MPNGWIVAAQYGARLITGVIDTLYIHNSVCQVSVTAVSSLVKYVDETRGNAYYEVVQITCLLET